MHTYIPTLLCVCFLTCLRGKVAVILYFSSCQQILVKDWTQHVLIDSFRLLCLTHGALLFTLHYSEADSFVPAAVTQMSRSCHICTDATEATTVYLLQFLLYWNVFILVAIYFRVFLLLVLSSVLISEAMSTFIVFYCKPNLPAGSNKVTWAWIWTWVTYQHSFWLIFWRSAN